MFFWLKGVGTLVTRTVCLSIYSWRKLHCRDIGVDVGFVLLVVPRSRSEMSRLEGIGRILLHLGFWGYLMLYTLSFYEFIFVYWGAGYLGHVLHVTVIIKFPRLHSFFAYLVSIFCSSIASYEMGFRVHGLDFQETTLNMEAHPRPSAYGPYAYRLGANNPLLQQRPCMNCNWWAKWSPFVLWFSIIQVYDLAPGIPWGFRHCYSLFWGILSYFCCTMAMFHDGVSYVGRVERFRDCTLTGSPFGVSMSLLAFFILVYTQGWDDLRVSVILYLPAFTSFSDVCNYNLLSVQAGGPSPIAANACTFLTYRHRLRGRRVESAYQNCSRMSPHYGEIILLRKAFGGPFGYLFPTAFVLGTFRSADLIPYWAVFWFWGRYVISFCR